jgi:hypothetical protein
MDNKVKKKKTQRPTIQKHWRIKPKNKNNKRVMLTNFNFQNL